MTGPTPRSYREQGGTYPFPLRPEMLARAIPQIERFLPAGEPPLLPFEDDEEAPLLFRFPSPRGLLTVASAGEFELTPPGVDAAFMGDLETNFAYPWVPEFGTVCLLAPLELSVMKVAARPGWFVCDGARIVPEEDCVLVPSEELARRIEPGMKRADAEDAMAVLGWASAVEAALERCRSYVDQLDAIDARVRELKACFAEHPDEVRGRLRAHDLSLDDLDRPTFELRSDQRTALMSC